jgi:CheY-like chemotaxis protein
VLGFVGTVLRDDGCEVFETGTPIEALKAIETEPAFDLLLVDYAMPEMSGVTVIERARACQQELKVLLMSGHADVLRAGGKLTIPLLAKPFKLAELRRRIGEILLLPSAECSTGRSVSDHFAVSD